MMVKIWQVMPGDVGYNDYICVGYGMVGFGLVTVVFGLGNG